MPEYFAYRYARGDAIDAPGRPLARLPIAPAALLDNRHATWCGDFNAAGVGFGHLKVIRLAPLPGGFGLRGDTVHLNLICDGFHRGVLSDPGLHAVAVIGPSGLGEQPPDVVAADALAHVELDIMTRHAFAWKVDLTVGRAPELQLAGAHLLADDLVAVAAGGDGLEIYFRLDSDRDTTYINLDGVAGQNFRIPAELFT